MLRVHEKVPLFRATLVSGSSSSGAALIRSQAGCKCSLSYRGLQVCPEPSQHSRQAERDLFHCRRFQDHSVSARSRHFQVLLTDAVEMLSSCPSPLLFASTATCQVWKSERSAAVPKALPPRHSHCAYYGVISFSLFHFVLSVHYHLSSTDPCRTSM